MVGRFWTIACCLVLGSACATGERPVPLERSPATASPERFVADSIERIGSVSSECDAGAALDRSTNWTCAGYSQGHEAFIASWEEIANNDKFRKRHALSPLTDWLYF